MAYRALIDFIDELEQAGELTRIGVEVDPDLELAEIAGRMANIGGPALLFQNVIGCRSAIAANLLATESRMCRALGVKTIDEITQRVRDSLTGQASGSWMDRLKWTSGAASADRWQPRIVKSGACQQVVRHGTDVDLTTGAFLRSWPGEASRFNRTGLIFAVDPETSERNVDRCDLQLIDRSRLAVLMSPRQSVARMLTAYRERQQRMPLAIVLGGDPAYSLLAIDALRTAIDPLSLAGLLRDQAVELVKCRSMDLGVPADADVVFEGFVDPTEPWIDAGPVGSANGFYSVPRSSPVMNCVTMTERTSLICQVAVGGHSVGEQAVLQRIASRILLPLVQSVAPDVSDFAQPSLGGPHSFLFASIRKTYSGQAHRVANALLGWAPLMATKFIVVVDDDINVHDTSAVWARAGAHVHPPRDIVVQAGPGDPADHAAIAAGLGQSVAIDATAKLADEHPRPWPPPLIASAATRELVDSRWRQYGLPPFQAGGRQL